MKMKLISILAVITLSAALAACKTPSEKPSGTTDTSTTEMAVAETVPATDTAVPVSGQEDETGRMVSFETTDLEGNPVSSADIFSQHKLTMVNVWGTFCGPCIGEMPDLEVLNGRLAEKDCAIIGLVCDVRGPNDTDTIEAAKEIVAETGVTYLNLLPFSEMNRVFPAMYIPTTYFVDENGQIVGEEAVGARGADDYEALVDELLEGI